VLEQRIALLEQQYQLLEGSMQRIGELKEFDKQLGAGK
jgi:Tfp pilus assembly protein PilN